MKNIQLPDLELVASKVHDAWWEEKKKQGFHAPLECESANRKSYLTAPYVAQDQFDARNDSKFYKWCDKCHTDMYPYNELPENVKDYDRVTVKTVYSAIKELS